MGNRVGKYWKRAYLGLKVSLRSLYGNFIYIYSGVVETLINDLHRGRQDEIL